MKSTDAPIALIVASALLWMLAVATPLLWSWGGVRSEAYASGPNAASQYLASLGDLSALRARLRDEEIIGYVSGGVVDTHTGGPAQARYYLTQYALAPVLIELKRNENPADHRDFVLANFENPAELSAYLRDGSREIVFPVTASIALTRRRSR